MLTVVLGLAVAIAMFWTEDPAELSRVWSTARNDYLLAGVLLLIITLVINTIRWYTLLRQLGYDPGFVDVFCQVS
ncbi:MAG: lysylphosphatidylglycerol synthase domain-containing protein, partial [Methanopyri archaeon]|nr:lysylphosphatidylglycerol synthase domain-containing protein [Methanopyri archaeon]